MCHVRTQATLLPSKEHNVGTCISLTIVSHRNELPACVSCTFLRREESLEACGSTPQCCRGGEGRRSKFTRKLFDNAISKRALVDAIDVLGQQFPSLRRIAEACCPSGDLAGSRVVDVGCGTGALVSFLTEAGVQEGAVIGIDMSCEVS